jgi:zinc/manganese transport system permease protein
VTPGPGAVFASGFFHSAPVHTALIIGAIVSVVCGAVGVFTVLRGQSFAGHAFSDLGTTGGSGAFLVGIGPLWGFVIAGVAAAGAMEMIGVQRARGRDLATGIVLGAALGLAALFLYLDTTSSSTTGATQTILFGSIFAVSSATLPLAIALGAGTVAAMLVLFRPLLLSSTSPELAAARGVPVRLVGAVFLLALALAAALAAITIGSILATALLIGPAATALRLARSPGRAILIAVVIAVAITWISIVLAYDSFNWSSAGTGWPVSFFVVTLALIAYVLSGVPGLVRSRRGARTSQIDGRPPGLAVR